MSEFCGFCVVCGDEVELSDGGFCSVCGQVFCWGNCGGWGVNGKHTCFNCDTFGRN